MKKVIGLFIGIGLTSLLSTSQTVIENSSKPQSKNTGRILEMVELMRITDENKEFFFKSPSSLNLDEEGFIYLQDSDFFLKFSPEGDFLGNLYHKGQGPGEVQNLRYNIQGNTINAWDTRGHKIVFYDLDGQFLREFKLQQHFGMTMVGHYGDFLIFYSYEMPRRKQRKGMIDINHNLLLISKDSGTETLINSFPIPWYVLPSSGSSYAPFYTLPSADGETLFINDSPEYRIKVVDTSTGEILRIFTRKYKRVKAPEYPPRPGDTRPKRKFLYDINRMFRNQDRIWVRTSTEEKEKGVLFDVFSPDGQYLDSFFIPKEVGFLHIWGDILFARNQDEEDNYVVVKYKIQNGPQIPMKNQS